jgi:hypothetical protein
MQKFWRFAAVYKFGELHIIHNFVGVLVDILARGYPQKVTANIICSLTQKIGKAFALILRVNNFIFANDYAAPFLKGSQAQKFELFAYLAILQFKKFLCVVGRVIFAL